MPLTSLLRILLTRSFKPFIFKAQYKNQLDFKDLKSLGLYVHIPFCRSLCSFCPYCKEIYDASLALRYKEALLKEVDYVCRNTHGKKTVTSLYFGGGTPSLMIDSLSQIIERLQQYFEIAGGIGVELHPEDVTIDILEKLRNMGVSMLSIGIQSFQKECLKKIGRTYACFEDKLSLAKSYGFSVIDVDLIFGIPGQNRQTLKKDIETAFACGATQVSTYPFIDFTFADNPHKPLSNRIKKRCWSI